MCTAFSVMGIGEWGMGMGNVKGFGWGAAEDRDLKVAPTTSYRFPIEARAHCGSRR